LNYIYVALSVKYRDHVVPVLVELRKSMSSQSR